MTPRQQKRPVIGRTALMAMTALIALVVGCGQTPQSSGRRKGKKKKSPIKPSADLLKERKKRKGRKKTSAPRYRAVALPGEQAPELTEQDFIENTEASRDPFRNYLKPTVAEAPEAKFDDTRVVLLKQYDLAELKLTGIAGKRPRLAMFKPPDNRTTNVLKGMRISKLKALVVEIAEDHVILQIPQLSGKKRATFVERIVWVDPNRKAIEVGSKPLKPDEQGIRYSGWRRRRDARMRRRQRGAMP